MNKKACCTFSLGSYFKQADDELHLTQDITFTYPMHLTLSDHVHHFIAPARVRHAVSHEKKPIPSLTSRLMRAMILLDEVVEIFTLPQCARAWHDPFLFQFLESFDIGRVFINRDDARYADMGRSKRF
jgi:hypothetical protein